MDFSIRILYNRKKDNITTFTVYVEGGTMIMNRKNRIKWSITIVCLCLCILLLPVNASASRSKADVKKILPEYSTWFSWASAQYPGGGSTDIHLICPQKDVTFHEILYFIEDITKKLDGKSVTDKTTICVTFPFSTDIYGQDYELFSAEADELATKLHYQWPYWSELNWMNVSTESSKVGKKYDGYSISMFFQLNTGKSDYIKKVNQIVADAKKKSGSNTYKLANNLCNWLYQNVDYNIDLATNSAYVAIMNGEAICGGFSNALKDLCDVAGIPCLVLTNQMEMDHAWNELYINGKWYSADVIGTVYSRSEQNDRSKGEFLFTDPNHSCDYPDFLKKLKSERIAPTPILTKSGTLTISGTTNLKKYIGNLSPKASVTVRSSAPSVISTDAKGNISLVSEGQTTVNIKVVQNRKTYQLTQKVKGTFPKKGTQITYKNGFYKIVKPAKTSKKKIIAGTVSFRGLSNKKLKSFTLPQKISIGKATYHVVQIEKNAFSGCKNLKNLNIKPEKLTKKTVGKNAFQGIHAKATIKVPAKKKAVYKKLLKSKGAGKKVVIK